MKQTRTGLAAPVYINLETHDRGVSRLNDNIFFEFVNKRQRSAFVVQTVNTFA